MTPTAAPTTTESATIEATLRALLAADRDLARLTGGRIYPGAAPTGAPLPYLVYQRISYGRIGSLRGPSGLAQVRIQYTAWSNTYAETQRLAERVRVILDGLPNDPPLPSTPPNPIRMIEAMDGPDRYEPPLAGASLGRYGAVREFRVWFEEFSERND